jgi:wyosine [tRNA(Phe)-imidazoG37] synthetase (radical SAM superfamily)
MKHIFGPIHSRRLGVSLGIDPIPYKTCSFDCIYCELGETTNKTTVRKEYISKDLILRQLERYLPFLSFLPDYITISGSGEPTLNIKIGEIIRGIKQITPIPVAVITNSSLLFNDQVKDDLLEADIVLPSLDAASLSIFEFINRPQLSINYNCNETQCIIDINHLIQGLIDFRKAFSGQIWLEILFCRVVNDDKNEVERIREIVEYINPNKIQLNTLVRPPSEDYAYPLSGKQLYLIKEKLGIQAEIISNIPLPEWPTHVGDEEKNILNVIRRRPSTCDDLSRAIGLSYTEVLPFLNKLMGKGQVKYKSHQHDGYYFGMNITKTEL